MVTLAKVAERKAENKIWEKYLNLNPQCCYVSTKYSISLITHSFHFIYNQKVKITSLSLTN